MRFILNSRFVTTWRLAIAGHAFPRSRQGRAHEPTREFRPAETQSLSQLVHTEDGRVQGWLSLSGLLESIAPLNGRDHPVEVNCSTCNGRRNQLAYCSDPRPYYRVYVFWCRVPFRNQQIAGYAELRPTRTMEIVPSISPGRQQPCITAPLTASVPQKILCVSSSLAIHPIDGVQTRQYPCAYTPRHYQVQHCSVLEFSE